MTRAGRCPTCGRPVQPRAVDPAHPFCSDRCRLLDLGKWLGEEYRIPGDRAGDGAAPGSRGPPDEAEGEGA